MESTTRKKTGGRKKGTLNKRSMDVGSRMERIAKVKYGTEDFDPLDLLLDLALEKENGDFKYDTSLRFQAAKELCQYRHAKLRSVEVKHEDTEASGVLVVPAVLSEEEYLKRAKVVKELHAD